MKRIVCLFLRQISLKKVAIKILKILKLTICRLATRIIRKINSNKTNLYSKELISKYQLLMELRHIMSRICNINDKLDLETVQLIIRVSLNSEIIFNRLNSEPFHLLCKQITSTIFKMKKLAQLVSHKNTRLQLNKALIIQNNP